MLLKVSHTFSDEVLLSKDLHNSIPYDSSSQNLCLKYREEFIVEDKDIVESKEDEIHPDLSLISRVSESQEGSKIIDKTLVYQDHSGKESLFWDFPNSIYKKLGPIVTTRDCSGLENSHKSLCDLMKKIKIKGRAGLRGKTYNRCPFDLGRSRWFLKTGTPLRKKVVLKGQLKPLLRAQKKKLKKLWKQLKSWECNWSKGE